MLYEYKGTVMINGNFIQSSTGLRVEAENKKEAVYLLSKRLRSVYHTSANVQINLNLDLIHEVKTEEPKRREVKPLIDLEAVLKKKKSKKKETEAEAEQSETVSDEVNNEN